MTAFTTNPVAFLASLFSFGVLVAFTAAQLAVIKLRFREPDVERPYRVPFSVRMRGADVPDPDGHRCARDGGDLRRGDGDAHRRALRRPDLARGRSRRLPPRPPRPRHGAPRARRARRGAELPQAEFSKILVPMKLGEIGEEMVATAVKLAQERGAAVVAMHVIRVPLDRPLDAELYDEEERAAASLAEAAALGARPRSRGRGALHPRAVDRRGDRPGGGGDGR